MSFRVECKVLDNEKGCIAYTGQIVVNCTTIKERAINLSMLILDSVVDWIECDYPLKFSGFRPATQHVGLSSIY